MCILALAAGLNPLFYEPVPCGEVPDMYQLLCEFFYFTSQNVAALLLILELNKIYGRRYTLPGIVLLAAKVAIEFLILGGVPIPEIAASVPFLAVFAYTSILIIRWEIYRRK